MGNWGEITPYLKGKKLKFWLAGVRTTPPTFVAPFPRHLIRENYGDPGCSWMPTISTTQLVHSFFGRNFGTSTPELFFEKPKAQLMLEKMSWVEKKTHQVEAAIKRTQQVDNERNLTNPGFWSDFWGPNTFTACVWVFGYPREWISNSQIGTWKRVYIRSWKVCLVLGIEMIHCSGCKVDSNSQFVTPLTELAWRCFFVTGFLGSWRPYNSGGSLYWLRWHSSHLTS